MQFKIISIAFGGLITTYVITLVASNQGNQVGTCANCFAQNWEFPSWQCDVHCDVSKSPYGKYFVLSITSCCGYLPLCHYPTASAVSQIVVVLVNRVK